MKQFKYRDGIPYEVQCMIVTFNILPEGCHPFPHKLTLINHAVKIILKNFYVKIGKIFIHQTKNNYYNKKHKHLKLELS